jgi:hypothetical protein
MESVAAERLNKLGKNPSIISTRHDLKRDAAVLKDIIDRATPVPSSSDSISENNEEESNSSSSLNQNKSIHFKSSLRHFQEHFNKSNEYTQNLNRKQKRRKKRK